MRYLFTTLGGSYAYGTQHEGSDVDYRGVFMYLTPSVLNRPETIEKIECDVLAANLQEEDVVHHEVTKFLKLARKGNPSILEMFFARTVNTTGAGERLRALFPAVLTKNLVPAHLGMAKSHFERLDRPGRNCGVKGRDAIEEYGYNTKDAMHVLRVLQQCDEVLRCRTITLPRPNAQFLKDVRNGHFSLDEVRSIYYEYEDRIKCLAVHLAPTEEEDEENVRLIDEFLGRLQYDALDLRYGKTDEAVPD